MRMRHVGGVVGIAALGLLHPGCGGTETHRVGLASVCRLSSDCSAPLLCTAGLCHAACADARDCNGAECVATADGKVCRLPADSFGPDAGSGGTSGGSSGGRDSRGGAGGTPDRDGSVEAGGTPAAGGSGGTSTGGTSPSGGTDNGGAGGVGVGGTASGGTYTGAGGLYVAGGTSSVGGSAGSVTSTGGSPVDAGPPLPPTSCQGGGEGLDTCGASGDEDCCTSLLVQGAPHFYRSYDGVTTDHKSQTAEASVSSFRLDKFEITIGRYRKFESAWEMGYRPPINGGKHTHLNGGQGLENMAGGGYEAGWDSAWAGTVDFSDATLGQCPGWSPAGTSESHPMSCMTWYEAYAFCIWDGGFLPSEAEWNYAASGGTEQRVFPWSSPGTSTTIDSTYAVYCGGSCTGAADVGSKPNGKGRYGQMDLAGNVWEWTLDASTDPYPTPCTDCALLPGTPQYRVYRGGSYQDASTILYASYRNWYSSSARYYSLGARCARTP